MSQISFYVRVDTNYTRKWNDNWPTTTVNERLLLTSVAVQNYAYKVTFNTVQW